MNSVDVNFSSKIVMFDGWLPDHRSIHHTIYSVKYSNIISSFLVGKKFCINLHKKKETYKFEDQKVLEIVIGRPNINK